MTKYTDRSRVCKVFLISYRFFATSLGLPDKIDRDNKPMACRTRSFRVETGSLRKDIGFPSRSARGVREIPDRLLVLDTRIRHRVRLNPGKCCSIVSSDLTAGGSSHLIRPRPKFGRSNA